ncbi:MAG TPA: long-chain fatty acid--CoA ligase [Aliidongia sp.]|nr:long-chain fatty acid--CoA ligase [Aliidongia sp.]
MTDFLQLPPYGVPQPQKDRLLADGLAELTRHHRAACPAYDRVLSALGHDRAAERVEDIPFLPVSLFKSHRLASVPDGEIVKILTSSGTTGQAVSRIVLDRETAHRQAQALAIIMGALLGPERLPMVLIDSQSLLRDRASVNARAAGVLGMMPLGRQHFFALDGEMRLDVEGLRGFLEKFRGQRVLLFGFTYIVWKHFAPAMAEAGLRFEDAILVHSGGWKKLAEEAVDNDGFKRAIRERTGIGRIHNFYGMAEQVGSVFVEGEDGLLYPPAFADIVIRNPLTLRPVPVGESGVVQVLSLLPRSYPGHSLLTEDLGRIVHVDGAAPGHCGKGFVIEGRVPRAELRGCSDVAARMEEA